MERSAEPAHATAERIRSDIAYLADDRLEGRGTGTAGNDSAAAWLARRYASLGLSPLVVDTSVAGCRADSTKTGCRVFAQAFVARGAELAHVGRPDGVRTGNVVAMIPGADPALAGQVIVIGAHFDHLGRSTAGSLDPEARDVIRNGADDNASGTAAVLELARRIADRPSRLTPVRLAAAPAMSPRRDGSNVYLGTIPDMTTGDVRGLKLTGVRAGSPADRGGLIAGDVIVQFGGREVKDLYTYSDALYAHEPGDVVEVVYLRGGERRTTTVTLGTRGQ